MLSASALSSRQKIFCNISTGLDLDGVRRLFASVGAGQTRDHCVWRSRRPPVKFATFLAAQTETESDISLTLCCQEKEADQPSV